MKPVVFEPRKHASRLSHETPRIKIRVYGAITRFMLPSKHSCPVGMPRNFILGHDPSDSPVHHIESIDILVGRGLVQSV